jgi:heme-degrading monooxygenase HmoA
MFCVIFEVRPEPVHLDTYLDLAMLLKPEVEAIDGFQSIERFQSRGRPGWLLSLQFWRDDAAIARWRTHPLHLRMQQRGRKELFLDYRLRVGRVVAEAGTAAGRHRPVAVLEAASETIATAPPLPEQDVFDSLYNPGRSVLLGACASPEAALEWRERALAAGGVAPPRRASIVGVVRDYGASARAEAPGHADAVG